MPARATSQWQTARVAAGQTLGSDGAATRRPAVDVARILALVTVVAGHLLLAVVDRFGGEVRGDNLLALHPGWEPLAALAPMPVFFAAAGWANAGAAPRRSAARLATLTGAGAVVVAAWSVGVLVAWAVAGEAGLVGRGARIATQPLWFLAAYVPFTLAAAFVARVVRRFGIAPLVAAALVVLVALDVARFAAAAPAWTGWPGFFVAWGVPWLLGTWWRGAHDRGGLDERRIGLALAIGGAAAAVALVATAGYSPALIDAVPGARSNTTPPTLFTAVAGIGQFGGLLVLAGPLDTVGRRWSRRVARAGALAAGIYVWHLTALALCVGVVALGVPAPRRLGVAWWLTRPVWWAVVLAVTAALVAGSAGLTAWLGRRRAAPGHARVGGAWTLVTGGVAATAGAVAVGLEGPRTPVLAAVCTASFVAGWWCLRSAGRGAAPR